MTVPKSSFVHKENFCASKLSQTFCHKKNTYKVFTCVIFFMNLHFIILSKCLSQKTYIRFFICVSPFVELHMCILCKCFVTIQTWIRYFIFVNLFMNLHVLFLSKFFVTNRTYIRFFTCKSSSIRVLPCFWIISFPAIVLSEYKYE